MYLYLMTFDIVDISNSNSSNFNWIWFENVQIIVEFHDKSSEILCTIKLISSKSQRISKNPKESRQKILFHRKIGDYEDKSTGNHNPSPEKSQQILKNPTNPEKSLKNPEKDRFISKNRRKFFVQSN